MSQLLCNTTHERTIYHDGSERDGFRTDYHPIKSATVKVIDKSEYKRKLFVKFESPYIYVSKKTFGVGDLERVTFQIQFNNLYTKSDYTGAELKAFFGDYMVMEKKNERICVSRTWVDSVSILFMECRKF